MIQSPLRPPAAPAPVVKVDSKPADQPIVTTGVILLEMPQPAPQPAKVVPAATGPAAPTRIAQANDKHERPQPVPQPSKVVPAATAPAAPTRIAKADDKRPDQPMVTTGVILLELPQPASPPAKVVPAATAVDARLKQRIEAVCGAAARDVEVFVRGAGSVQVRLKARSDREGEQLSTRIFQMSELGPYHVSLDVQVVP
jgi:hypothetical protein